MHPPADPQPHLPGGLTPEAARALRHDLRTPLHAILGFAELLAGRALDPDARRDVEQIRGAARRLQAIVDDIP